MVYLKGSDWTDREDKIRIKRTREGFSAALIGAELGKSRGAVLGRKKRKGDCDSRETALQPIYTIGPPGVRGHSSPKPKRKAQPKRVKPPKPVPVKIEQHPEAFDFNLLSSLEHIKPHQCRWAVVKLSKRGKFLFCGNGIKEESSYCAYHHKLGTTGEENVTL